MTLATPSTHLPVLPDVLDLPLRDRPATLPASVTEWTLAADARFRACAELRADVLPGIRVGVKDTVAVAGFPTRLGLRHHRHYPRTSAPVLSGVPPAWINAKLTTTELGIGLEHGCVSPYFPHLDPGGSSTGCAVAVAANICDLAMGTDTVASVRLPAAACGVVGLRLTHDPGLLDGLFGLSAHLDAPGWLTRTVDDLRHVWDLLDLSTGRARRPVPASRAWRIGVVGESVVAEMETELTRSFHGLGAALTAAGHDVVDVRLDELFRDRHLAYQLCAREASSQLAEFGDEISTSTRLALEFGAGIGDDRLAELVARHHEFRERARSALTGSGVDAWLLPAGTLMPRNIITEPAPDSTIPRAPGPSPHVNYAAVAAFLGLPAVTFPVGHSAEHDAPVSVQLIGPEWTEDRLIAMAGDITATVGHNGFRVREEER
jgi:Asp-tRNA(Asn)/Glu-tRNA(Gln) amidotransferase A subunit family amidase